MGHVEMNRHFFGDLTQEKLQWDSKKWRLSTMNPPISFCVGNTETTGKCKRTLSPVHNNYQQRADGQECPSYN